MQIITDPKSELVQAIEKRARKAWTFEISTALAKGGPSGAFRMRVATVVEQDKALVMAHRYVAELTAKETTPAGTDAELLGNAKVAYLMQAVSLHPERDVPIFPSGRWLLDHTTTDELSVLLSHYQEILRLSGPIEFDLSEDRIEGLAALLAAHADTDGPNIALLAFTREQVGEIAVRLALLLKKAKAPAETDPAPPPDGGEPDAGEDPTR